jgi:formate dehydrogenase subunit delta
VRRNAAAQAIREFRRMEDAKLVTMLNQIAAFHRRKPADLAVAEIVQHVQKYWEKRMRIGIIAHLETGGAGLSPNARAAVAALAERQPAETPKPPIAEEMTH